VVNFSARCNVRDLVRDLIKCGGMKGIVSSLSHHLAHFQMCSNSCLLFVFPHVLIYLFAIADG
jgi:hypothetical protein